MLIRSAWRDRGSPRRPACSAGRAGACTTRARPPSPPGGACCASTPLARREPRALLVQPGPQRSRGSPPAPHAPAVLDGGHRLRHPVTCHRPARRATLSGTRPCVVRHRQPYTIAPIRRRTLRHRHIVPLTPRALAAPGDTDLVAGAHRRATPSPRGGSCGRASSAARATTSACRAPRDGIATAITSSACARVPEWTAAARRCSRRPGSR